MITLEPCQYATNQPGPDGETSSTYALNPLSMLAHPIQQSVMPLIVKFGAEWYPVGTGFVISNDLIVTAGHVLDYAESKKRRVNDGTGRFYDHYELYALYLRDEEIPGAGARIGGVLSIEQVWRPVETDIGFCRFRNLIRGDTGDLLQVPALRLSPGVPHVGEAIAAVGYYAMETEFVDEDALVVHHAQRTAVATGNITALHPSGGRMGRFPVFQSSAPVDAGMSGGPIFNREGNVCGVCSWSIAPTDGCSEWESYGSLLFPAMGAEIDVVDAPGTPASRILIADLVRRGAIPVDQSFEDVHVVQLADGRRTVSVRQRR
ncbi:MAG TPA: serine protease [Polyangia bacterium]|nr:serine protease [Polyangia bacterium]